MSDAVQEPVMRLRFLGTAAAEAFPAPFCRCPHCQTARRNRGRDLRRRSALLVNGDLLIDFGPDVFQAFQQYGLDASRIETVLLTHGHSDHLEPSGFDYRRTGFISGEPPAPMTVCGPQDAIDIVGALMLPALENARLALQPLAHGDTCRRGDYGFVALPAVHGGEGMECLLYIVERCGRRFLYATDTGPLADEAWDLIAANPPSVAIMDCTMGTGTADKHMGISQVIAAAERLRRDYAAEARVIAHHFSHQKSPCYDELVRILAPHGIDVAYDGMIVDV